MSDLLEDLYAEVSTTCDCENEDGTPSTYCFGCYDENKDWFLFVLNSWKDRQADSTDTVRIEGENMTWQRLGGYAVSDFDDVYNKLTLNGEFTLRLKLTGDTLTCIRTSHDEPTGASFTFQFLSDEEE